jgi:hypothetical protein
MMNKRHRTILKAFRDLGGEATLGQVSEETGLNVNGLSQSMNAESLREHLFLAGGDGTGRGRRYKVKE